MLSSNQYALLYLYKLFNESYALYNDKMIISSIYFKLIEYLYVMEINLIEPKHPLKRFSVPCEVRSR